MVMIIVEIWTSKKAYAILTEEEHHTSKKLIDWEYEIGKEISHNDFMMNFTNISIVTNIPKLRSFQYRLLHHAVITNAHLFRWGIKNSNRCTFCEKEKETYIHLFVYCKYVEPLWLMLEQYMYENIDETPIRFDIDSVFWNSFIASDPGHVKNMLCLVTKQYIYKKCCFAQKPNCQELISIIKKQKNIEKYIAVKNNRVLKHCKKWKEDFFPTGIDHIDTENM